MAKPRPQALIAWSSGKDRAWALHVARRQAEFDIVGALTTVTDTFARVSMHGVREELLRAPCMLTRAKVSVTVVKAPTMSNSAWRRTSCSAQALSLPLDQAISAFGRGFAINHPHPDDGDADVRANVRIAVVGVRMIDGKATPESADRLVERQGQRLGAARGAPPGWVRHRRRLDDGHRHLRPRQHAWRARGIAARAMHADAGEG